MRTSRKNTAIIAGAVLGGTLLLTGCNDKLKEPYKDAGVESRNDQKAVVASMPDGFNNVATKCLVPGIRVTVIFHSDSAYGAVDTIADPNCR
jgi:hypothetical protein